MRSLLFLVLELAVIHDPATPSGDGVNSYVVSKAIRNAGIKVALSGVGGDELFAGERDPALRLEPLLQGDGVRRHVAARVDLQDRQQRAVRKRKGKIINFNFFIIS